jgi:hypothetical protein
MGNRDQIDLPLFTLPAQPRAETVRHVPPITDHVTIK